MNISDNLQSIQKQIADAVAFVGREASEVNLVAVSKKQPDERIQEALDAGHRLFGENRVQEAQAHWAHRRDEYSDLRLHLIGPLQTNKAKEAVALFDVIETLDREKLARALSREMEKQNRHLPCFIQVNTGEEKQKAGIAPSDVENFYDFTIQGLMCIPPVDEPPALHFALLQKYAEALGLKDLSMGMSSDFEKAIPLGATYVRVGTGVFGQRDYDL